jgi:hypothetical protein
MGAGSEEALKEIEQTREALGEKVDALIGQVKETAGTARRTGMKVGLVALGVVAGFLVLKKILDRR